MSFGSSLIGEYSWLNGEILPTDCATTSWLDHGFTAGDGTYETLAVVDGRPFAVGRHLARLRRALGHLEIALDCDDDELRTAIDKVITLNSDRADMVRLIVAAGESTLKTERSLTSPTTVIGTMECPTILRSAGEQGVSVITVPWCRNELGATAGYKTISNIDNVLASRLATKRGASEALIPNTRGDLCEGSSSNVFVVIRGELFTPPTDSGCLPGITRGLLIGLLNVSQEQIAMEELQFVDEAFLASSTRGVQAIASIDGRKVEASGPLTACARNALDDLKKSNIDP